MIYLLEYFKRKPVAQITTQGAPIVNSAWITRRNLNLVHISMDLKSKYSEVVACGSGMVMLGANERTLKLSKDHARDDVTMVSFPRFEDWMVVGTQTGRYSVDVILTRPMSRLDNWLISRTGGYIDHFDGVKYEGEPDYSVFNGL